MSYVFYDGTSACTVTLLSGMQVTDHEWLQYDTTCIVCHVPSREVEGAVVLAYLRRCFADILQASFVHGSCQDDIAVIAHDMGFRVVELEGFCSRILILDGPLADSCLSLLESLRQTPTASKDVHCTKGYPIIFCMSPAGTLKMAIGPNAQVLVIDVL